MLKSLFEKVLNTVMVHDQLRITYPDGSVKSYGPQSGETVGFTIHTPATLRRMCINPELGLGEGFMDGTITLNNTSLDDLLRVLITNRNDGGVPMWLHLSNRGRFHMRRFIQRNTPERARANVAHHYDISDALYQLFLDEDMQYSCAYFTDPDMSLEQAQIAKKSHIAAKLRLEPDNHVLDIGCGWGGMALTLARDFGVRVTGVTLSQNQLDRANARARAEGLEDRVTFRLQDYRNVDEKFDRIVSVGMLEHVGVPNYSTYFAKVADLLKPKGVGLIHTIGRSAPPLPHSAWINKYIFPGGYVPSLSELAGPIEKSGLWQTDIEVWRLHYAQTIRHWRTRFETNLDKITAMYDDRFVAMFRYYFAACIVAFEHQMQAVYQFQLTHERDAVPLTRAYLHT
ncbi:SAM-dependent methyltransferase [Sulfitobacter aestuariivivens]|uniref:Class I SAM-dependent methyltransferase n=1 Tax=Sulfitobacter aestuariivivens TaxID=2766981 RepID=A0A927HEW8_9RHOB|nr:cyclopropane-fatty-acyl-phospholipid synthase family protein [Sulfitobacter aestuariivivens]MBD3664316.1 class I SAM-dependent methyltransferase [Sulfitobacter aestuariivivens]